MNRFFHLMFAVVVAGVMSVGAFFTTTPAFADAVDRIVAIVGSEAIASSQLSERLSRLREILQAQGAKIPAEKVFRRQVLDQMILERVQMQYAKRTGNEVDDATIDRAIGMVASNNKITVAQLREEIKKDGLSWDKYRDDMRLELTIRRLREHEVDNKVSVSNSEIDNFIRNHPEALSGVEYHLAHIIISVPVEAKPAQLQAVSARVDQIFKRLNAGEAFTKLAREYSDSPDKISGGDIGWRSASGLPGFYAQLAAQLEVNGVSEPVRSAEGVHIVKLLEKRTANAADPRNVEQTHARHILLKTSQVLSDEQARARLKALRERIVHGEDFAQVAKANSADLSSAKGGDLGWVSPGDTVPEFERAMNELSPKEVSQPVQTQYGWHLVQVLERRNQDVSKQYSRNVTRAALKKKKSDAAYEDWLRQLRDSTYVEKRLGAN